MPNIIAMGVQKSATTAVGLLEIGQSQELPDPDFVQLGKDKAINFVTLAPLDAYTEDELARKFEPAPDELPISSMTASGQRILVSRSALELELQKGVREAARRGLNAVVVTCTGEFILNPGCSNKLELEPESETDRIDRPVNVILPGDLLRESVRALLLNDHQQPIRKVAILVPVDEQKDLLAERWVRRLLPFTAVEQVQAFTLSPQSSLEVCRRMSESLATDLGFDTAIMDCFGYSLAQYKAVGAYLPRAFNAKAVSMEYLKTDWRRRERER